MSSFLVLYMVCLTFNPHVINGQDDVCAGHPANELFCNSCGEAGLCDSNNTYIPKTNCSDGGVDNFCVGGQCAAITPDAGQCGCSSPEPECKEDEYNDNAYVNCSGIGVGKYEICPSGTSVNLTTCCCDDTGSASTSSSSSESPSTSSSSTDSTGSSSTSSTDSSSTDSTDSSSTDSTSSSSTDSTDSSSTDSSTSSSTDSTASSSTDSTDSSSTDSSTSSSTDSTASSSTESTDSSSTDSTSSSSTESTSPPSSGTCLNDGDTFCADCTTSSTCHISGGTVTVTNITCEPGSYCDPKYATICLPISPDETECSSGKVCEEAGDTVCINCTAEGVCAANGGGFILIYQPCPTDYYCDPAYADECLPLDPDSTVCGSSAQSSTAKPTTTSTPSNCPTCGFVDGSSTECHLYYYCGGGGMVAGYCPGSSCYNPFTCECEL